MISLGDGPETKNNINSKPRVSKQPNEEKNNSVGVLGVMGGGLSIYQHQNLIGRSAPEQVFKFI
jgi:hypothetical protein